MYTVGLPHEGRRRDYAKMVANVCYTSTIEPTNVTAALTDEHWILAIGGTTAV